MPAPKRPNTAAATAVIRRRGDETAAARLRKAGWLVVPPEVLAELPAELLAYAAVHMPKGWRPKQGRTKERTEEKK